MQRVVQSQTQFDLSKYLNSDGQIRWVIVNQEYLRGTICNEELIEIYRKWRDQDEYAVFCEFLPDFKLKYHAMKCAKRGNDVYNWRIKKRFKELDELGNLYGDNKIFDINLPNPQTNCLFLTLTYDTKLDDKDTAWKKISTDYNRAITRLRKNMVRFQFYGYGKHLRKVIHTFMQYYYFMITSSMYSSIGLDIVPVIESKKNHSLIKFGIPMLM